MIEPIVNCPTCKIPAIDDTTDDGGILFRCDQCDWRMMERHYFNVGSWIVTLRQALAPLDILQSVFTDESVVSFIKPRLKGISHLSQPIPNFDLSDDYYKGEIEDAYGVYLNQLIVLVITYAELIIKDFYSCLFRKHPQRMNIHYSADGKGKGMIELNEILKFPDKETLIEVLARRASSQMSIQKLDRVEKLINDCKIITVFPVVSDLKGLYELRNRIVHEGKHEKITVAEVTRGFGQVSYLLYVLGEIAIKMNVIVLDEVCFLENSRSGT